MRTTITTLLFLSILYPSETNAQDNWKAGLFTEAKQLPVISQGVHIDVLDGSARIEYIQYFKNDGSAIAQADYYLDLPASIRLEEFGFWNSGRYLRAEVKERSVAERAHKRAARSKRATAIVQQNGNIRHFSIYPVLANETKKIRVVLRADVTMFMGQSSFSVPIQRFLGQRDVLTPVSVNLQATEALSHVDVRELSEVKVAKPKLDVEPEFRSIEFQQQQRSSKERRLLFSSARTVQVLWKEKQSELVVSGRSVLLPDSSHAIELTSVLPANFRHSDEPTLMHILLDQSYSMRRRYKTVRDVLKHFQRFKDTSIKVHLIGRESEQLDSVSSVISSESFSSQLPELNWASFRTHLKELACTKASVQCLVITDPQTGGIEKSSESEIPVLILADSHELEWAGKSIQPSHLVFSYETGQVSSLLRNIDELVRPSFQISSVAQGMQTLDPVGFQSRVLTAGSMNKLLLTGDGNEEIAVQFRHDDKVVTRKVELFEQDVFSKNATRIRKAYFRHKINRWMHDFKQTQNPDLKTRIIEIGVREQIPTVFTSMQVEAPTTSLYAIKPGDPTLSVSHEYGLKEVVAVYPFGETRRMKFDSVSKKFYDRFLVPRFWPEKVYKIDVIKYFENGRTEKDKAYYRIDNVGPSAIVRLDKKKQLLVIDTSEQTHDVSTVEVRTNSHNVYELVPLGQHWVIDLKLIQGRFRVVLRDRAGNRSVIKAKYSKGILSIDSELSGASPVLTGLGRSRGEVASSTDSRMLFVTENKATFQAKNRRFSFLYDGFVPRSLRVSSHLVLSKDKLIFGTEAGDIVVVDCSKNIEMCTATPIDQGTHEFPVTGITDLPRGRVLVSVLGKGLFEINRKNELEKSEIRLGTRLITAMQRAGKDILVGTARRGLWRIVGSKVIRTRFSDNSIYGIESQKGRIIVQSSGGTYQRIRRDRYRKITMKRAYRWSPSRAISSGILHNGHLFLGNFDTGLKITEQGREQVIEHSERPKDNYVNQLAVFNDNVWMATEGGLFEVILNGPDYYTRRVLRGAVYGLASSEERLAVAYGKGVLVITKDGEKKDVGFQAGIGEPRFGTVQWHDGDLFAGGLDGLYRFGEDGAQKISSVNGYTGGWVTALLSSGPTLYIGTYEDGVYEFSGETARQYRNLQRQWVPPHALGLSEGQLYVGGLGMPGVLVKKSGVAELLPIPVRDTNGFVFDGGRIQILTSDGRFDYRNRDMKANFGASPRFRVAANHAVDHAAPR
ncbi:MAG: VIT domain-containing protein [Myxococcota bacterium]|nr:VIT domain-containing protein [Myxococcota bacterium]